jgi:AraC-like DNA-binding protein
MQTSDLAVITQSGLFAVTVALSVLCLSLMRTSVKTARAYMVAFLSINIAIIACELRLLHASYPSNYFWLASLICLSFLSAPCLSKIASCNSKTVNNCSGLFSKRELGVVVVAFILLTPLVLASQVIIDFTVSAEFGRMIHISLSLCVSLYILQVIYYLKKVSVIFNKALVEVKSEHVNLDQISLITIKVLFALVLISLLSNSAKIANVWFWGGNQYLIIFANLLVSISFIACFFFWIHKRVYFAGSDESNKEQAETEKTKYQKTPLSQAHVSQILTKLKDDTLLESVIFDNALCLTRFAKHLGEKPQYISQVLNQTMNLSFYDFVSQKRLKHVVSQLKKPHKNTILELAFEAGFNSKSTFNTAFKAHFNCTPSQYKKNIKK